MEIYKRFISENKLAEIALFFPQWTDFIVEYLKWSRLDEIICYFSVILNIEMEYKKVLFLTKVSKKTFEDFKRGNFNFHWLADLTDEEIEYYNILYEAVNNILDRDSMELFLLNEYHKTFLKYREIFKKRYKSSITYIEKGSAFQIIEKLEKWKKYFFRIRLTAEEKKIVRTNLINKIIADSKYENLFFLMIENELEEETESKLKEYLVPYIIPEKSIAVWVELGPRGFVLREKRIKLSECNEEKEYYRGRRYDIKLRKKVKKYNNFLREGLIYFYENMEAGTFISLKNLCLIAKNPFISLFLDTILFIYEDQIGYVKESGFITLSGIRLLSFKSDKMIKVAHPYELKKEKLVDRLKDEFKQQGKTSYLLQLERPVYIYNKQEYKTEKNFLIEFNGKIIEKTEENFLERMKLEKWRFLSKGTLIKIFYGYSAAVILKYESKSNFLIIENIIFYEIETGNSFPPEQVHPVVFTSVVESIKRNLEKI